MQFAGFRSVVRTIEAVDGARTDKVMFIFYENVVDASGHLDLCSRSIRVTQNNASR